MAGQRAAKTNQRHPHVPKETIASRDKGKRKADKPAEERVLSKRTKFNPVSIRDFECLRTLGEGGFAKVLLVRPKLSGMVTRSKRENRLYAMKVLRQDIMSMSHRADFFAEMRTLSNLPWNPFIAGFVNTFHDEINMYLLLELIPYRHLLSRLFLAPKNTLESNTALFYTANIVCAIAFLHNHGVVHCDIKPENILIGADGYLALADFGMAKTEKNLTPRDVWAGYGTTMYRAIELQGGRNNPPDMRTAKCIDWWSLGCIVYEMHTGEPAWEGGEDDKVVMESILRGTKEMKWPTGEYIPTELRRFITSLLTPDPIDRLGVNGANEIKQHEWLSDYPWSTIMKRTAQAPWIPERRNITDVPHTRPLPRPDEVPSLDIVEPPRLYQFSDIAPRDEASSL
ncbi:kinase-like protein [Rickenella mellea]|uniref:cAMP-dependent protein kinase n=1 Tax=Rickenella mellea TaxID=50990 RepID=A0A4Y7QCW2_9AGAM|nr:kinase-like protein [Rickenella mellea]